MNEEEEKLMEGEGREREIEERIEEGIEEKKNDTKEERGTVKWYERGSE